MRNNVLTLLFKNFTWSVWVTLIHIFYKLCFLKVIIIPFFTLITKFSFWLTWVNNFLNNLIIVQLITFLLLAPSTRYLQWIYFPHSLELFHNLSNYMSMFRNVQLIVNWLFLSVYLFVCLFIYVLCMCWQILLLNFILHFYLLLQHEHVETSAKSVLSPDRVTKRASWYEVCDCRIEFRQISKSYIEEKVVPAAK